MKTSQPYSIGITGGSASGKTQFLEYLKKAFREDEICVLQQDNYYIPREEQPLDENGMKNFDTLQSIDIEAFVVDFKKLLNGETVTRKEYTFNNPKKIRRELVFRPAPIVVAEGLFILNNPELVGWLNLKIFIEAKNHIRLKRRITRDNDERGYDLEDVLYRYEKHVDPTFEMHIEPYKSQADIIIQNNNNFDNASRVLISFLRSISAN